MIRSPSPHGRLHRAASESVIPPPPPAHSTSIAVNGASPSSNFYPTLSLKPEAHLVSGSRLRLEERLIEEERKRLEEEQERLRREALKLEAERKRCDPFQDENMFTLK